jgi:hypothetical protein
LFAQRRGGAEIVASGFSVGRHNYLFICSSKVIGQSLRDKRHISAPLRLCANKIFPCSTVRASPSEAG